MSKLDQVDIQSFLENTTGAVYEEELLRNPYSFRTWWQYLQSQSDSPHEVRCNIYRRALGYLPGSYKLWNNFLLERRSQCDGRFITEFIYSEVNEDYELCLTYMHKMPKIWLAYCDFLCQQKKVTKTRRTFDTALQSLPITQHELIWPKYIAFAQNCGVAQTAVCVYRRYIMMDPSATEDYIKYLKSIGKTSEAALQLAKAINNEKFISKRGHTRYQLWNKLIKLLCHDMSGSIPSVRVDSIVRSGIAKFSEGIGQWWCMLAEYYTKLGDFEMARNVYEEALKTVVTFRDFEPIFLAYCAHEIALLEQPLVDGTDDSYRSVDGHSEFADLDEHAINLELQTARATKLMERRPLLENSVRLRQNPHDVNQWHQRVKLFDDPTRQIMVYNEAIECVDVLKAVGKPHSLWVSFARLYESLNNLEFAEQVFEKAVCVSFKTVDECVSVWCEWVEMYLKHRMFQKAMATAQRAVTPPRGANPATQTPGVHRSQKLWGLLADLEESFGTIDSVSAVYENMIELKVVSPKNILNYATILEENNLLSRSFGVYERGVSLFDSPQNLDIWKVYISKFFKQYGGSKKERMRDIFENCLAQIPSKESKSFYLQYARFEEMFGRASSCVNVLERACECVSDDSKFDIFILLIYKIRELQYGAEELRAAYLKAMESVPRDRIKDVAIRFAAFEVSLMDIERARSIFVYSSQFNDPRTSVSFWKAWKDFEIEYGNKDTHAEFLRTQHSVQASFAQNDFMDSLLPVSTGESHPTVSGFKRGSEEGGSTETAIAALERQVMQKVDSS